MCSNVLLPFTNLGVKYPSLTTLLILEMTKTSSGKNDEMFLIIDSEVKYQVFKRDLGLSM